MNASMMSFSAPAAVRARPRTTSPDVDVIAFPEVFAVISTFAVIAADALTFVNPKIVTSAARQPPPVCSEGHHSSPPPLARRPCLRYRRRTTERTDIAAPRYRRSPSSCR